MAATPKCACGAPGLPKDKGGAPLGPPVPGPPPGVDPRYWLIFLEDQILIKPNQNEGEIAYRLQPYAYLFRSQADLQAVINFIFYTSHLGSTWQNAAHGIPGVANLGWPTATVGWNPGGDGYAPYY